MLVEVPSVHLERGKKARLCRIGRTSLREERRTRLHVLDAPHRPRGIDEGDVEWNSRAKHPEGRRIGLHRRVDEEHPRTVGEMMKLHESEGALLGGRRKLCREP